MLTRLAICAGMAAARLGELAWSRHNITASGPSSEGRWSRRTYPAMVALHAAVLLITALHGSRRPRILPLIALLAVQPVRFWVLLTLGRRWNTRAAVPAAMAVATAGPYRYVRHPNYAVVAVELAALPLAFRLPRLAVAATAVNAILLGLRIPEEEALLGLLPGYHQHFAALPRFVPRLSLRPHNGPHTPSPARLHSIHHP